MKQAIWLLMLFYSATAFGQKSSYEIKGKMSGWNKGKVVLFYNTDDKKENDTTDIVDGNFKFTGEIAEPMSVVLVLITGVGKAPRDTRKLYLDGGKVRVSGKDSLKRSVITGSKLTNEFEELHAVVNPLSERFVALKIRAISWGKTAKEHPEYLALEKEHGELIKSIYEAKKAFVYKYPASFVSLMTTAELIGSPLDYEKIAPLYEVLSPALKHSALGQRMGKAIAVAKITNIGVIMPDFTSLDTLRKPLSLTEVVKKGKLTLVDFWASWCKPCRAENPNVVKAFNAFHDKGFNILSVSLDNNEASWKKAIAMDGMPWYHVSGLKYWDEPVAKQFGINGVPDSFLLDAEGKVIARALRGEQLYKKIEQLLK